MIAVSMKNNLVRLFRKLIHSIYGLNFERSNLNTINIAKSGDLDSVFLAVKLSMHVMFWAHLNNLRGVGTG